MLYISFKTPQYLIEVYLSVSGGYTQRVGASFKEVKMSFRKECAEDRFYASKDTIYTTHFQLFTDKL